jgi:sulfur relay (sulfurtransferase) complex TusBCD TusD component (DsrE family)
MASFCFLLDKSNFDGDNFETLYHLASAAIENSHKVFIYLSKDGVYIPLKNQRSIDDRKNARDLLNNLVEREAEVMVDGLDIWIRGIDSSKSFIEGIKTGGLSDLSEAIAIHDKIISL